MDHQNRNNKLEHPNSNALEAVATVHKPSGTPAQVRDAEGALKGVDAALEDGAELEKKDAGYQRYAASVRAQVEQTREKLAQRALQIDVALRRGEVDQRARALQAAVAALARASITEALTRNLQEARDGLEEALREGKALEARDKRYAAYARGLEEPLRAAKKRLQICERALEILEGPARWLNEALALMKDARAEAELERAQAIYKDAREKLKSCADKTSGHLAGMPEVAGAALEREGRRLTPERLRQDCQAQLAAVDGAVAKLKAKAKAAAKMKPAAGKKGKKR
jgi:hypothetical protein